MTEKSSSRTWLFLVLVIIVILMAAGLGYYLFIKKDVEPEPEPIVTPPSLPSVTEPKESVPEVAPEEPSGPVERQVIPEEKPLKEEGAPSQDQCQRTEKDIQEFFRYLDNQKYVQDLDFGIDSYSVFKKIVSRLSVNTPIPAGEGIDSNIIIKNLYHFFRVLDTKHIYLIKEVLSRERDTMEYHLRLFYTWLTLGEKCPDPENIRPSISVLYKFAGFFLNTTGGRAYLSRRPPELRILVTYYSTLLVHKADLMGKNSYGINIHPFIEPLRDEISRYSNFQFQKDYLNKLNSMEDYYRKERT